MKNKNQVLIDAAKRFADHFRNTNAWDDDGDAIEFGVDLIRLDAAIYDAVIAEQEGN